MLGAVGWWSRGIDSAGGFLLRGIGKTCSAAEIGRLGYLCVCCVRAGEDGWMDGWMGAADGACSCGLGGKCVMRVMILLAVATVAAARAPAGMHAILASQDRRPAPSAARRKETKNPNMMPGIAGRRSAGPGSTFPLLLGLQSSRDRKGRRAFVCAFLRGREMGR